MEVLVYFYYIDNDRHKRVDSELARLKTQYEQIVEENYQLQIKAQLKEMSFTTLEAQVGKCLYDHDKLQTQYQGLESHLNSLNSQLTELKTTSGLGIKDLVLPDSYITLPQNSNLPKGNKGRFMFSPVVGYGTIGAKLEKITGGYSASKKVGVFYGAGMQYFYTDNQSLGLQIHSNEQFSASLNFMFDLGI